MVKVIYCTLMKFDYPGEWGPEKDCYYWLTFWKLGWRSSSSTWVWRWLPLRLWISIIYEQQSLSGLHSPVLSRHYFLSIDNWRSNLILLYEYFIYSYSVPHVTDPLVRCDLVWLNSDQFMGESEEPPEKTSRSTVGHYSLPYFIFGLVSTYFNSDSTHAE